MPMPSMRSPKTMHIKGCDTPLPMAPVQGKEPFWSPRSQGNPEFWSFRILRLRCIVYLNLYMAVCQNLVPLVNIKIAGKWMFIPLKMVSIGIDPYPHSISGGFFTGRYNDWIPLGSHRLCPASTRSRPGRPSWRRACRAKPSSWCSVHMIYNDVYVYIWCVYIYMMYIYIHMIYNDMMYIYIYMIYDVYINIYIYIWYIVMYIYIYLFTL